MNGTVAEGYEPVRTAFARNFETLDDKGASVAVYHHGRRVVHLWYGTQDVTGSTPWQEGTAQIVRSATKGVAAAAVLLLHQRGALDLDAPVGTYWPEYKAAGKDHTLVRHLLSHQAGVPALDHPLTAAQAADQDLGAAAVAAQTPAWTPGTAHGYHPHTFSWTIAELVRRVTGRPIAEFIATEITQRARADFWLGLPPEQAWRVGRTAMVETTTEAAGTLKSRPKPAITEAYADPGSLTRRAFGAIVDADENEPAYRAAQLPGSTGFATADGLARIYASLTGELDGVPRLFTPETVELARAQESSGPDRVLVVNSRFGLGYMLHSPASPFLAPTSFGHPGRGGPLAFADPESGIAFGYVTNGFRRTVTADPRPQALVRAVRESLAG
ncbi:serine hydrolase domain-containing protein [Streptomyces acidiscabies]|uniref:serine hydrolase domain-containing protein n=1 Tax=Streptomyces acidiscabies TaxID=42234 RepID=UPI0009641AD6|nr:serine hydrolase domain-containing protein [Streptomyces acidiscabies]GAV43603.1 esterase EstB [Streptomyces acidiscabies]